MGAFRREGAGQRRGFWRRMHWASIALALLLLSTPLLSSPAHAASTTVKGHPILNSGSGSAFTQNPSWSGSTYVTLVSTLTYTINASTNVTSVTVEGSKNVIPGGCTVTATVTVKSATGSTLSSGSANLKRPFTTFSETVTITSAVYYHTMASTTVTFAQSGGSC